MNEYITSGINGILYDPYNPNSISFFDIGNIRERAAEIARQSYVKWLNGIPQVIGFIRQPMIGYKPKRHPWVLTIKYIRSIVRYIYKKMIEAA
jgi:hypothetical protein